MFSHHRTTTVKRAVYPAGQVVIPFAPYLQAKQSRSCIFCGQALSVHVFKDRHVCLSCLKHISALFA
ncbi:MAG: hypothetical protein LBT22_02465 [Peptococcaceae bacterium]|jgi:hypothetical protein|nr:hypothetical protein [Peptococcaceae bacterium]